MIIKSYVLLCKHIMITLEFYVFCSQRKKKGSVAPSLTGFTPEDSFYIKF